MCKLNNLIKEYQNKIGQQIYKSNWLLIDQEMINKFASLTMDNQFIHIDKQKTASETPFGSTIAHGFLVLSLSTKFFLDAIKKPKGEMIGINYGFNKIRFINPVLCNDKIRGIFDLQEVKLRSRKDILFKYRLTTEIKNKDKPALVCEWLSLSVF